MISFQRIKQTNRCIFTEFRCTSVSAETFCSYDCFSVFFLDLDIIFFLYNEITFCNKRTLRCYNILCHTTFNRQYFNCRCFFDFFRNIPESLTFLTENCRELCVRCKSNSRKFSANLDIMFYTGRTALFITSEQHTDSSVKRKSQILNCFQRIKCSNRWTFIILHTASVHLSILYFASKRIMAPPFPKRNNIQMSQNADHLFAFTILNITYSIINISRLESQLFSKCQGMIQGLFYFPSVRCIWLRFPFHAADCNALADAVQHLILQFKDFLIQSFITHCCFTSLLVIISSTLFAHSIFVIHISLIAGQTVELSHIHLLRCQTHMPHTP